MAGPNTIIALKWWMMIKQNRHKISIEQNLFLESIYSKKYAKVIWAYLSLFYNSIFHLIWPLSWCTVQVSIFQNTFNMIFSFYFVCGQKHVFSCFIRKTQKNTKAVKNEQKILLNPLMLFIIYAAIIIREQNSSQKIFSI